MNSNLQLRTLDAFEEFNNFLPRKDPLRRYCMSAMGSPPFQTLPYETIYCTTKAG